MNRIPVFEQDCTSQHKSLTEIVETLERFFSYANPETRHQAIILHASELGVSYWQLYHLWATYSNCNGCDWMEQEAQQWGVN